MKDKKFPDFTFKNAEGIKYQTVWKSPAKSFKASGLCDSPNNIDPEIWIDPTLEEKRLLEVMIEEIIHAHFFEKTEKQVRKLTNNIRRILYKVYNISFKQNS